MVNDRLDEMNRRHGRAAAFKKLRRWQNVAFNSTNAAFLSKLEGAGEIKTDAGSLV